MDYKAFMKKNDLEKVWMVRNFKTVYRDGKRNKDKKRIEDKRAANSLHSKVQPPGTSLKLQKLFGHFGTDGRNFQDASELMKCLERNQPLTFSVKQIRICISCDLKHKILKLSANFSFYLTILGIFNDKRRN
ncbi:hypothetical protein GLOIN_2v1842461 [Rhizophagus irregularis DAOM 181602=DAOM 197198]|uniref:Uncharacterized protein n=1 Tax=Rhizophagus irregularis (strain DAOM 181602 / DAOM 197198 / MUCL 43194) TaxID=747089 RepID=A0A2P4PVB5_RHIID|nr:hypothetical protein GLOIN_2v1842461 [Rhizophagus irregularis DAOM 181602=DAOM 197198]POG69322.1 hypothetical protein GLOIN_2v1842461 [Rhizophagus irregularis DAOM 181602=DAOM 197198]|eukprot:XP_025176188.1 hypothetical protein GLOIN_2v1842461 [Rhizophagus irregularis DAOM 181602=DAOM 197198]